MYIVLCIKFYLQDVPHYIQAILLSIRTVILYVDVMFSTDYRLVSLAPSRVSRRNLTLVRKKEGKKKGVRVGGLV